MNKKTKYIDDLFKDELGSYTETPPPAVWDRLEKKLDNKPPQATGYNRRRLWYFGVLSLVLLVGVVVSLQLTGTSSIATKQFSSNEANRTGSPNTPSHNNSGGNKTGNENQSSAANNDVNRNSASDLPNSVLPTPLGPRNKKLPIGRLASRSPTLPRRTARATACTASVCPTTRWLSRSSIESSFSASASSILAIGIPVQAATHCATSCSRSDGRALGLGPTLASACVS